ncbi:hypothetical protein [Azoarcus sp. KH32C]|uniref:hypothetical protein n=1 Tax=Azoarcus sp. KH32C TaxID=748247 RepID=UPI0002386C85|nr:hypothetical protein [Azoarcus sp. KH32C]BAL24896.1 hypothetical protein AZKH_2590 [Azoarcus sp. KH32C]
MHPFQVIQKLHPSVSVPLTYLFATVGYIWRFTTGTSIGVLILSAAAYYAASTFGSVKPFSFGELIVWIAGLSDELKAAALTSVLTITGFLIAFHSSTASWKKQVQNQLKLDAAVEIEGFFAEVSALLIESKLYAQSIVDAVIRIRELGATSETQYELRRIVEETPKFLDTRQRISALSVGVHRLAGKNHTLLSTVWGGQEALANAIEAFQEIAACTWFPTPYVDCADERYIDIFVSQVDITKCATFIETSDAKGLYMNAVTGGLRGILIAPVMELNLSALCNLAKHRRVMGKAFGVIRDGGRGHG